MSDFMPVKEMSEFIHTPVATLYDWSYRGEGPPVYKVGRRLLYKRDEVLQWIEAHRRGGDAA